MPYGISPTEECFIPLPNGNFFVFPAVEVSPEGADYVRIVNSNGGELVYWSCDEWRDDPDGVMGAICGAMVAETYIGAPNYYQFAADCEFPPGIEFTPCGEES